MEDFVCLWMKMETKIALNKEMIALKTVTNIEKIQNLMNKLQKYVILALFSVNLFKKSKNALKK